MLNTLALSGVVELLPLSMRLNCVCEIPAQRARVPSLTHFRMLLLVLGCIKESLSLCVCKESVTLFYRHENDMSNTFYTGLI